MFFFLVFFWWFKAGINHQYLRMSLRHLAQEHGEEILFVFSHLVSAAIVIAIFEALQSSAAFRRHFTSNLLVAKAEIIKANEKSQSLKKTAIWDVFISGPLIKAPVLAGIFFLTRGRIRMSGDMDSLATFVFKSIILFLWLDLATYVIHR
jgi:sterol desaturase/sphingolipid hydroxylase (fatty acid hydroxylase superfamily)